MAGLGAALRAELPAGGPVRVCTFLPPAMDTPFFTQAANYSGRQPAPIPPVYETDSVCIT